MSAESCSQKSANFKNATRKSRWFTLEGVGITCLSSIGYCRYLENVNEVIAHVFFRMHSIQTIISNIKQNENDEEDMFCLVGSHINRLLYDTKGDS